MGCLRLKYLRGPQLGPNAIKLVEVSRLFVANFVELLSQRYRALRLSVVKTKTRVITAANQKKGI